MNTIRTRFAPSPTGFLHIGGVRTTLYAYLLAKKHHGKIVLRIEDTDQKRTVAGSIEQIINTFKLLGIDFDEGPTQGGEYGPYTQSERKNQGLYQGYADTLIQQGHAYHCFCTADRLETMRSKQQAAKQPPKYDRECLKLSKAAIEQKLAAGEQHVIRLKVPEGETTFTDLVYGTITTPNNTLDDQVLLKSDGFPTYHLAVVIDDHLMNITHVIRGNEWIPSTPKHVILYNAFGWDVPVHAHLPPILGPDGKKKLSKRDGDVRAEDFIAKGYLPEALLNFIALLGWNPGDDQELFDLDALIQNFSLERVNKSGAKFDMTKLNWMNNQYIKNTDSKELVAVLKQNNFFDQIDNFSEDRYEISRVLDLFKERMQTLAAIGELAQFLYTLPDYEPSILVFKKSTNDKTLLALEQAQQLITNTTTPWIANELRTAFDAHRESINLTRAEMFWPMRVAVSGSEQSPDVFDIMELLGREETLERLRISLEKIKSL